MVRIDDVVSKLLERAEEDSVPWKATADDETFAATFGNLSVLVSSHRGTTKLSVLNEKGTEIESTTDPSGILYRLHTLAKRKALGTADLLAELMDALNGPPS